MSSKEFKALDLVLADFEGYPPWPSVLMPYQYLLDNRDTKAFEEILRDPNNTGESVCVCFLNDKFFGWNKLSQIQHLTPDKYEAVKTLKKGKSKLLLDAYNIAKTKSLVTAVNIKKKNLDNLEDYKGGNIVPTPEQLRETFNDDASDDEPKIQKKSPKPKTAATTTKASTKPNAKTTRKRTVSEASSAKETAAESTSESEHNEKKVKTEVDDSPEGRRKKVLEFRRILQKGLLQRDTDPTTAELNDCSDTLDEVDKFTPKITKELISVSKLHKVLKAIAKTPELESPDVYKFHERCNKILVDWEVMIHELRLEKERLLAKADSSAIGQADESNRSDILSPKNNEAESTPNGDILNGVSSHGEKESESDNTAPKEENGHGAKTEELNGNSVH